MTGEGSGVRTILVHLGDQRRSRTDSHGIVNFSLGLVRALPGALAADERLVVLVNEELEPELGTDWLRPIDRIEPVDTPTSILGRLRIDHWTIVRVADRIGADTVVYPKGFLPLWPFAGRSGQQVVCVHDDIPARQVRDPELSRPRRLQAVYFTLLGRWSAHRADVRLFVSDVTARRVRRGRDARPEDTTVGEGITLPRQAYVPLAERLPQAVLLGSHLPHKRTAAGLGLVLDDPRCRAELERVVLVGADPGGRRETSPIEVEHRPGPLSSADLAELLARSRLLVFPSRDEGFGLPPIEAYALGTPAVHRRTPAGDEVLADVPGRFDDETPDAFGAAVGEAFALRDDELRQWSEAMWTRFDWPTVAARVVEAIRAHA